MKMLREMWRNHVRPWWSVWEWPVVVLAAVAAFLLGVWGFWLQAVGRNHPVYAADMMFQALQLFLLQVTVESPVTWPLEVARWLAPAVAGYAAIQALGELLTDELAALSVRLRYRGHAIVCGLGRKGMILARGLIERGQRVVVIEQDAENDLVQQCRDLGVCVLIGDAADEGLLRKAGAARAKTLFAVCGDDGVNAEISVRASRLLAECKGTHLTCLLHIVDPHLYDLLRKRELRADTARPVRLEFFNTFDLGARLLLEEFWGGGLDGNATAAPAHMVIVGMGRLGESIVVNAARRRRSCGADQARLDITMIDQAAGEIAKALAVRYPGIESVCNLRPLDMDVRSAAFQRGDFLGDGTGNRAPACVFICLDDDSLSLATALALVQKERDPRPMVVVRMAQESGLASLFHEGDASSSRLKDLRAFGLLDRTCHPAQVERGTLEILARGIHETYLRQQMAAGVKPEQNPSMAKWDSLPGHLQESNRQQAADICAKLTAVNCSAAPLRDWREPLFSFEPAEVEFLAIMEHDRWMAEKVKGGWRYGPTKDAALKTHPSLIPFDQLSVEEQDKDRSAIRAIPSMLAGVGFHISRRSSQKQEGAEADCREGRR